MSFYMGPTEPVTAAEVAIGDLLVHDRTEAGYLKVTSRGAHDGMVLLRFETGDIIPYPPGQKLYRVATGGSR